MLACGQTIERDSVVETHGREDQDRVDHVVRQHLAPVPVQRRQSFRMKVGDIEMRRAERILRIAGDRIARRRPFAAQAESGGVLYVPSTQRRDAHIGKSGVQQGLEPAQVGRKNAGAADHAETGGHGNRRRHRLGNLAAGSDSLAHDFALLQSPRRRNNPGYDV